MRKCSNRQKYRGTVYKSEKLSVSSGQEEFFQAFGYRTFIFDINAVMANVFYSKCRYDIFIFFMTENLENEFSS
jgi:hypothetical protein